MEYKRKTRLKYTEENCKLVYDKNGDIVMDRELFDLLCEEHNYLCEIEDKIENGTLVELPCKVGDTVYVIYQYCDFLGTTGEPFIEEDIAKGFVYDKNKMKIVPSNYAERNDYWCMITDILLTREEAEKRLEELKK